MKYVKGIPFIQYNKAEDSVDQSFAISKIPTIELRKSAAHWHKIMGHAGPKAINIAENPPCDTDSEDDKVIEPTENFQRNQPDAGLSKGMEK